MGRKKVSIKGQEGYNNFGSKMIVSEDSGDKDINIYFPEYDWTAEHRQRSDFKSGTVKCPYEPRVYGHGYIGEGKYKIRDENGKQTKCYKTWKGMLERCYSDRYQEKRPTYIGCTVCEEWHNFQVFTKWYYENIYFIEGQEMHLDKDILNKHNKIYSPKTCVFVPERINSLFIKCDKKRGKYPIGIYEAKNINKLNVQCSIYRNGKNGYSLNLGYFELNQVDEAFQCYKEFKEKYIKQIADEYKELIPTKLYDALYRYEVEITD